MRCGRISAFALAVTALAAMTSRVSATTADGTVMGVTQILNNGPAASRFDIVIMGDGYLASELPTFQQQAQDFVDTLRATPPFNTNCSAFNVWRVDVASNQSGADDPAPPPDNPATTMVDESQFCMGGTGAAVATFFDSTFCGDGVIPRALVANGTTAINVMNANVPGWNQGLILVNSGKWGGTGGTVAVFSRSGNWEDMAIHELGHSAFGLADEYEYWAGCGIDTMNNNHPATEPSQPNVTIETNPATVKWAGLFSPMTPIPTTNNANCMVCDPQADPFPGQVRVGLFEGAHYHHCDAFRPTFDCMMRNLSNFCPVCTQRIRSTLAPFEPANRAPTCDADGPYTAECVGSMTPVVLDGSDSADPDCNPLTLTWTGGFAGGSLTGVQPTAVFSGPGTFPVMLSVTDGTATATCSSAVTVQDTLPPILPPDVSAECTSPGGAAVNIGMPTDQCDNSLTATNDAPATFPIGTTPVHWTVTDDSGNTTMGTQTVTVADTTPPALTVSATPDILWPPNHTLRNVHVSLTVDDTCDDLPLVRLESITSSEPDSGTGPLDKPNDIQGASLGTDDRYFRLRAEHGPGAARTYTITYSATDDSGNVAMQSVVVRVPKSTAELISRDGPVANDGSTAVAVSSHGAFLAFPSDASNLITGGLGQDRNDLRDVFRRDRTASPFVTAMVSLAPTGAPALGASHAQGLAPAISGDGRFVAFYSDADDLVTGDLNGQSDVFVRDFLTGTTERISLATGGTEADGASLYPSISEDGRFVAFQSFASNLVSNDTNQVADIFLRDRTTGTTTRICDMPEPNGPSSTPSVDGNGTFVAFASDASNLVPSDTNRHTDIFVCNVASGVIDVESVSTAGAQGNDDSILPAISSDGTVVAYKSEASNLVANDRNGLVDVFATDRVANTTERISVSRGGGDADGVSFPPSVSGNGRFVAFGSLATNLAAADSNNTSNVFVRDRQTARTLIADVNDDGQIGNRGTLDVAPALTRDGIQIGFVSLASNLAPAAHDNEAPDVFIVCNPFLATAPAVPPMPLRRHARITPARRIRSDRSRSALSPMLSRQQSNRSR